MDATNEWMDDTEKLLKSFNVGMDPEEASKVQEKTEVSFVLPCKLMLYVCWLHVSIVTSYFCGSSKYVIEWAG